MAKARKMSVRVFPWHLLSLGVSSSTEPGDSVVSLPISQEVPAGVTADTPEKVSSLSPGSTIEPVSACDTPKRERTPPLRLICEQGSVERRTCFFMLTR